jgi:MFS family permease
VLISEGDVTGVEAAAATGRPALTARDRRARIAASADFAVQGLCFGAVITQVPKLVDKFQLTDVQLTVVMASVPFIAGLGSIVAGMVAPRTGSAFVLRSVTVGVSVFAIVVGLANSLALLYAAVALFGFFVGGVDASMNMQGVAVQRRYGRSILASCHAWWSIAGIGASLAASQAHAVSVAAFLACAGGVGLVLALSAGPSLLPRQAEDAADEEPNPVLPPVPGVPVMAHQGRVVLLIGIAVMIMFIGDSGASQWSTIYLQKQLIASDRVMPLGFAAYLAFQLLGRAVADWVISRIGAIATLITGAVVAAGGFAVVALAPVPAVAIGGFALVGVGLSVVVPLAFSAADALDPAGTGTVIARVNLFNYAGVVLGAALVGVVGGTANYRVAFAVPGVLVLLICAVAPSFRLAGAARARSTAA